MIPRYSTPEMDSIWSPEEKFRNWAKVEIAVLQAKYKLSYIHTPIPENLIDTLDINPEEIDRIEAEITGHDVKAFLEHTEPQLPEELQPHWHNGMTSYDPQDTGLSLTLAKSTGQLLDRLSGLMIAVKEKAHEHKHTAMIGRTHGVHAEPITFGVKLANYYEELQRHQTMLLGIRELVSVGKISGAVGMYTLDPKIEQIACKILELKPIISTQIIARDILARYMTSIAVIGGTIEKICVNIRNLQRTEIREVQEYFRPNQTGSSAMPHKRNPISSENLSGQTSLLRGYAFAALEKISTWDERDLSNSGPERIYVPDASTLFDYMLKRATGIIRKLIVYPHRMAENLKITQGLIFSQDVQSLLAQKGNIPRETAYKLVRDVAQECWDIGGDFIFMLFANQEIMSHISQEEVVSCFDLKNKLKHVDHIFKRVFGKLTIS